MAPKTTVLVICGASVVVGICLIVTSSLTLDFFRTKLEPCKKVSKDCEFLEYWVTASSFGIIASLIQIASLVLGWMGRTKAWCGLHIFICVLTLTAFAIAVTKEAFTETRIPFLGTVTFPDKVKAFTVFCGIDMVFSLIVAIVMFRLGDN